MPDFDNNNRGVLFRNFNKPEGSKQPDYTGKLNVGGIDFELAGWLQTSKKGAKYLSLKVQPAQAERQSPAAVHPLSPLGDDIPF